MLRPAFLLVTVATFFAFVSIGVVLPGPAALHRESPLGAGSVAVGIAVGAAGVRRHSSPSRPPGGSSGRDWGGYTVEEAALRHGAGVEEETDDTEAGVRALPASCGDGARFPGHAKCWCTHFVPARLVALTI